MLHIFRNILKDRGLDGFLIPKNDRFMQESTSPCEERLKFMTGFSGSAGMALITQEDAYLFVDGRYTTAAKQEAPHYHIQDLSIQSIINCIREGAIIGFDPWVHTIDQIEKLSKYTHVHIHAVQDNPVDIIWRNRPVMELLPFLDHSIHYAGEDFKNKIERVQQLMNTDFLFITHPDCVSWLLNIRSNHVPYSPIVQSFALLPKEGMPLLMTKHYYEGTKDIQLVHENDLKNLTGSISLSPSAPHQCLDIFKHMDIQIKPDVVTQLKSIKNSVELKGATSCHQREGDILKDFLRIIKKDYKNYTEWSASELLSKMRGTIDLYQGPSFETISAINDNGAIIHYRPSKDHDRPLCDGLYLIDSGGQYLDGTTDVTRTIALGEVKNPFHKTVYTAILKGMIDLSYAIFPKGTTGSYIDILARRYLFELGLDYPHGTGHGVGSYLNVHEGPQSVSKYSNVPLEEGMLISNEPGYYKEGDFGIRIENMMRVVAKGEFLGFETLTKVPFDRDLIDDSLLSTDHCQFINEYGYV
jgi:Xaa-Pro aminopeptidase